MAAAMDEMDPVFKALADPHRRHLLDRLHERDGQTLSELQSYLPLSRFGCMKHLRVLEDAGLVTSRKVGREKFHFLNPVPIQRAYDRWVEKYRAALDKDDFGTEVVPGGTKHAVETSTRVPDLHPGQAGAHLASDHRSRDDRSTTTLAPASNPISPRVRRMSIDRRTASRCSTGQSSRAIPRAGW